MTGTCANCGQHYQAAPKSRSAYCSDTCRQAAKTARERARTRSRKRHPRAYAGPGPHHLGSVTYGRARAQALHDLAESNPTPHQYAETRARILEAQ